MKKVEKTEKEKRTIMKVLPAKKAQKHGRKVVAKN